MKILFRPKGIEVEEPKLTEEVVARQLEVIVSDAFNGKVIKDGTAITMMFKSGKKFKFRVEEINGNWDFSIYKSIIRLNFIKIRQTKERKTALKREP